MNCQIFEDKQGGCWFRDTNMIPFGPIFEDWAEAQAFLEYLTLNPHVYVPALPVAGLFSFVPVESPIEKTADPRAYPLDKLMDLFKKFRAAATQEKVALIEETLHRR